MNEELKDIVADLTAISSKYKINIIAQKGLSEIELCYVPSSRRHDSFLSEKVRVRVSESSTETVGKTNNLDIYIAPLSIPADASNDSEVVSVLDVLRGRSYKNTNITLYMPESFSMEEKQVWVSALNHTLFNSTLQIKYI